MTHPTPRPWRIVIDDTGGEFSGYPSIVGPDETDTTVIHRAGFKQRHWESAGQREIMANAELIVAAVNDEADLRAALYWIAQEADGINADDPDEVENGLRRIRDKALAALNLTPARRIEP